MSSAPTVFVVDDDRGVRESLCQYIHVAQLNVETFSSAQEFLDAYDPERPGCLLLDVKMPGMTGLELQQKLIERSVRIPVLILTGHADVQMAVRAFQAGAFDFVEKPYSPRALLDRIRQAIARDARARRERSRQAAAAARFARLTPRENEVLRFVVAGHSSKQIANRLGISFQAVDAHRRRVMAKLEVESVAELVRLALEARAGNTPPPPRL